MARVTTGLQNRRTRPSAIQSWCRRDRHFYWVICPWRYHGHSSLPPENRKGVWIDCKLFESQVCHYAQSIRKRLTPWYKIAGLANIASKYLIAGKGARRMAQYIPQLFPTKSSLAGMVLL